MINSNNPMYFVPIFCIKSHFFMNFVPLLHLDWLGCMVLLRTRSTRYYSSITIITTKTRVIMGESLSQFTKEPETELEEGRTYGQR